MVPAGPAKVPGNRAARGAPANRRACKAGPAGQGAAQQQTRWGRASATLSLPWLLEPELDLGFNDSPGASGCLRPCARLPSTAAALPAG